MTQYITKEQKEQLVNEIKEIIAQQPELSQQETLKAALDKLGITTLPVNRSNANRYMAKAKGKSWKVGSKTPSDQPPEMMILAAEKVIQEQLKLLNHRRDILMQDVKHLDDLISRYKAIRKLQEGLRVWRVPMEKE